MKVFSKYLIILIFSAIWMAGIVLAKGFWSTLFAIFFFPWGFYLVIERLLVMTGVVT